MSAFADRYNELFEFANHVGWDGHAANPVCPLTRQSSEQVWMEYGLANKEHTLEFDTLGQAIFEVPTVHGVLELVVFEHQYYASITKGDLVVMAPTVRDIVAFP